MLDLKKILPDSVKIVPENFNFSEPNRRGFRLRGLKYDKPYSHKIENKPLCHRLLFNPSLVKTVVWDKLALYKEKLNLKP